MNAVADAAFVSCPRCGEGLPPGARFCSRCGLDLVHEAQGPVPASPVTPPLAVQSASLRPSAWMPAPIPAPAGSLPSAIGRRATRAGWFATIAGALLFLAASLAILAAAGVGPRAAEPVAKWDPMLSDPTRISSGVPFTIEVEARNPGALATARVWVVIAWRPSDGSVTPGASGRFVGCAPATCSHRDDPVSGTTVVHWRGLGAGDRQAYGVTVSVTGIEAGDTLVYRVSAGTGADEGTLRGGLTWGLELEVE